MERSRPPFTKPSSRRRADPCPDGWKSTTPKHGSWLNVAGIELSALNSQCLNPRIPNIELMRKEVAAGEQDRNNCATTIDWRFTTEDARIKLKRIYPK